MSTQKKSLTPVQMAREIRSIHRARLEDARANVASLEQLRRQIEQQIVTARSALARAESDAAEVETILES